jgi:NTE family protein
VFNPLPVEHVKRQKDDLLVVVDLNSPPIKKVKKKKLEEDTPNQNYFSQILDKIQTRFHAQEDHEEKLNYFNFINKTIEVMQVRISTMLMDQFKPDLLIKIPRNACGSFDYYRAEEMIELGKQEFRKSHDKFSKK